ncbi:hypothetical protein [Mesorhizobium sp. M0701]|uniref:hypothetical protein n=1 Tax=Mesorhizobium sp. M0701 TaxID=2956989 RepID=UPI00333677DF
MISTLPSTPQCSAVPSPCLPTKPTAWLSSTMTIAPYFSAVAMTMELSSRKLPKVEQACFGGVPPRIWWTGDICRRHLLLGARQPEDDRDPRWCGNFLRRRALAAR